MFIKLATCTRVNISLPHFLQYVVEISESGHVTAIEGTKFDVFSTEIIIISNEPLFEIVSSAVHRCKSQLTEAYLKTGGNNSCLKVSSKDIS